MADPTQHRITLSRPLRWLIGLVVCVVVFAVGFGVGRATRIPFSTAWWRDFAGPVATGTAGVFALSAGAMALLGSHLVSSRSHATTMVDIEHRDDAAKASELWTRFEWLVNAASPENPDDVPLIDAVQAAGMVVSIRDAAKAVKDTHLVSMLNVFMGEQQDGLAAAVGLTGDTAPAEPDNGGSSQTEVPR
ncbi:hypothetical protein [Mycolicibacterium wolinskyi]|nr:hypothetical protein [Mycolicibacterium wolinskyi]